MPFSFNQQQARTTLFAAILISSLAAVFIFLDKRPAAAAELRSRTESHDKRFPNYDIRMDKAAVDTIAAIRASAGKSSPEVADARDTMVRAEQKLRQSVPTLKVEYNLDLKIPEIIAPDVKQGRAFLTRPSTANRAANLKTFLIENAELIGASRQQIDKLNVFSNYTNPDGHLSFVELNQEINGVPVFRGEIKAGFAPSGAIIRVINNFAPGLDEDSISTDFGNPINALRRAAAYIGNNLPSDDIHPSKSSTATKVFFGKGDSSPTAEKMYFPVEPGVAVPAWRVLIWQPVNAYYIIVDANRGTLLWRKNLTEDQTQAATYNVYSNPNAMANIADSPFPMTPGPLSPNGIQAAAITRTLVTRIGNEPPYTFNNLGWITDGGNTTDGNNVQAGLDREDPNNGSLDAEAIDPNGMALGSPIRVFDFPVNPSVPSNPAVATGDAPLPIGQTPQLCLEAGTSAFPTDFQKAAITHLFYVTNVFHDEVYRLGFTESARNFQDDNFGRGGLAGDRISAQAQDCSGITNANFSTPADGERPQMQMYLWPGPNPDIDGSFDSSVIIHELAHGLSNRLHGNGSGLVLDIARGMGEGWSDFYSYSLLSEPTDPIDGLYTLGAYDAYQYSNVGFNNYYYGIRRFPMAIRSSVGGPDNRPHNPLTFADIDATEIDTSDGAFAPRYEAIADQVHAIGEVWGGALWEVRARMVQRLGWETGNRRMLQYVTDGMKLAPIGPTPLSERDALIAVVFASGGAADLADMWAGFATRGIGASATIDNLGGVNIGSGLGAVRVTESFDLPNIAQVPAITVSDASGDNDGYPEPGEQVTISIPLTNATGTAAANVLAEVVGGGTADFGTISGISTVSRNAAFTIPPAAACGGVIQVTLNVSSSLGPLTFTRSIFVGRPATGYAIENFDALTAPAFPSLWNAVSIDGGLNFVTATAAPDSPPNAAYAQNPTSVGGGTNLTAPPVSVTSAAATVTFRHRFSTERNWDGGVLEISIAGAPFEDFLAAGGIFIQNGYSGPIGGGRNNPLASRAAWNGNSQGYITTVAQFPPAANGRVAQLRWRFGADDNTAGTGPNPGWHVDSIALSGAAFVTSFACTVNPPLVTVSGRVLTPSGLPLRNAAVTMTDSLLGTRTAVTSSFGLFQFDNVETGQTYTIGPRSKRYRFAAQIVNLTGELTNLEFRGLE